MIEVLLSIGIVSFVFLPMAALLTLGMETSAQAVDLTIESQIARQITSRALQTDFSGLSALSSTVPTYYDVRGNKTDSKSMTYLVNLQVNLSTPLPGSGSTSKMATVTISILNTKRPGPNKSTNLATNPEAKKYLVLVADNGL